MKRERIIKFYSTLLVVIFLFITVTDGCNRSRTKKSTQSDTTTTIAPKGNGMKRVKTQKFTADLSGENEVPAIESDADGSVSVILQGDSVHVKGQFSGLGSAYASSEIIKGGKNKNGKSLQTLQPSHNSENKAGSWGGSYYWDQSTIKALKRGALFVNIASKNHPEGEIRGQLKPSDKGEN